MSQKQNGSGRRVLTYPAVHPCESISTATLLNSSINLAHFISNSKPQSYTTNNRNARESVRQIRILHIFLSELRNSHPDLPDSLVLGLSELHLTFQKLQHLLQDCSRKDARLWMLMNSERVANQFRLLTRSISTALEVLLVPLETIELSLEVMEYVELILKQTGKTPYEVELNDKATMNDVLSVLNQFEYEVVPDKSVLKRVLDYLGIVTWGECNREVKFFETEIAFESTNEKRKVWFLSSLMSFVSYCRCVVFDAVEGNEATPTRQFSNIETISELLSSVNSDDFRCPISLEFMVDPVTLSTGHTYDRASITKWFKAGKNIKTCPKTGQKLVDSELVPNLLLKRLIQQYCLENGIPVAAESASGRRSRDVAAAAEARSSVAERAMRMVASYVVERVEVGTEEEKNRAVYEIRVLSKTSGLNRACFVESGVIPRLLRLLKNVSIQENAIAALLNLSKYSKSRGVIGECGGGVGLVVDVMKKGVNLSVRQHGAGVLFYLSSIEECRRSIGENPEAIPGLIELIKEGNDRGKKNALVAIFGLLLHHENHCRVVAAGTVQALVNLLKCCDREDIVTDSLAILATLAEKHDGTVAVLRGGALNLNLIVAILDSDSCTSKAGKEYCVSLLLALCLNGGADAIALLVKSPSLMESLYSLLREGTSRASKKASTLIRVLHGFYESRPSGSMSPVLPQERFIHAW
ncbi:U-box domain-containing protein 19 [Quercus suber]|uniref:RING-type E3 ubiquitin transferase n=1 Tax=Quercus suber TaxID=58331 RepID=A0AAW0JNY2_QUESU|nr:U-box domain-containing protein 19-like [Quercus suber]